MNILNKDTKIGANAPIFKESIAEVGVYETMRKLHDLGIHYIENSQMSTDADTMKELRRACDDFDMHLLAVTVNASPRDTFSGSFTDPSRAPGGRRTDNFEDDWDKIIGYMKEFNVTECRTMAAPPGTFSSVQGLKNFAKITDELGARLADLGITFHYHPHAPEYNRVGGEVAMYILKDYSTYLGFELCPIHIQKAGLSVYDVIRDFSDRGKIMHLTDYKIVVPTDGPGFGRDMREACEIGEGNLGFEYIIKLANDCGKRYMFYEQGGDRGGKTEFESIKMSFENMRKWGYGANM